MYSSILLHILDLVEVVKNVLCVFLIIWTAIPTDRGLKKDKNTCTCGKREILISTLSEVVSGKVTLDK